MRVIKVLRSCWTYIGEVLGEGDYKRYVAYLQTHQPCAPIPTEREYWRMRWAEQERNPQGRCC
jgi:hypothetical protein